MSFASISPVTVTMTWRDIGGVTQWPGGSENLRHAIILATRQPADEDQARRGVSIAGGYIKTGVCTSMSVLAHAVLVAYLCGTIASERPAVSLNQSTTG